MKLRLEISLKIRRSGNVLRRKGDFLMPLCIPVFLLLFAAAVPAFAERSLPEDYIKYPVAVTLDDGSSASGFYLNDENGDAYFVSARHLFFFDPVKEDGKTGLKGGQALLSSYPRQPELKDPILIRLDLKILQEAGFVYPHESRDVTVVKLGSVVMTPRGKSLQMHPGVDRVVKAGQPVSEGSIVGAGAEVIKKYDEASIGNDVFIFGYPNSLGIENYPQIDYDRPLLRKGVIAGKNDKNRTIILDCPVYYGNSGGPVIEAESVGLTATEFHIIGMVSEFIPFDDKWYGLRRPFGMREIQNSGYSVVVPMDDILELIEKHRTPPLAETPAEAAPPVPAAGN